MPLKLPIYNYFAEKAAIQNYPKNLENNTLIVFNESENELVTTDFFNNILKSVNLQLGVNTGLLKYRNAHFSLSQLLISEEFSFILFFDLQPTVVGLNFNLYDFRIQKIGELYLVKFPAIKDVSNSVDNKKKLWEIFKKLYK